MPTRAPGVAGRLVDSVVLIANIVPAPAIAKLTSGKKSGWRAGGLVRRFVYHVVAKSHDVFTRLDSYSYRTHAPEMSLIDAARNLHDSVRSTDRLQLRYTSNQFPDLDLFDAQVLADWVAQKLTSDEILLVDQLLLEIRGQWKNYRFPQPKIPE